MNTNHNRMAQFSALTLAAMTLAGAACAQVTGGFTGGNVVVYTVDGSLNPISLDSNYNLLPNAQFLVPDLMDTPHDTPGPVTFTDPNGVVHTYPANTNVGGTALSNFSELVRLLELTPAGAPTGKYYNFPVTASGANHRLTVSGTAGSVGGLSVSRNGKYLMSTGIDAAVGGRGPIKANFAIGRSNSIHYPRVVGLVDFTNPDPATAIDTTTALTNAFDQENITNVAWTGLDTDPLYIAGNGEPPTSPAAATFTTTGGVVSAFRGATVATQNYAGGATSVENVYRVNLYNGALYGSAADAGSQDAAGVAQGQTLYGLALLTPGTTTVLPGFAIKPRTIAGEGPKPYDFFFASPTVVYIADAGTKTGGLQKYIYHPAIGQWGVPVAGQTYNSPDVTFDNLLLTGLAGTYNAQGQTVIYAIANGTALKGAPTTVVTLTDTGDVNAIFTQIAAPSAIQTFRGIQVVPPTMSGRVALEGVADTTAVSPYSPLGNITVKYRLVGSTATYFSQTVPLTADAANKGFADYTLPGVAPGYYDLQIKTPKNLAVALSNVQVGGPFTLPDVTLTAGDSNNDNSVDSSDFGSLIGAFNSDGSVAGSGYDPTVDFNYDGVVDSSDFGILIGDFNTSGAN